jgi:hypothetical protein
LAKFSKLRDSLTQPFPLQCEVKENIFAAFVDPADPAGTMHFTPGYFRSKPDIRASKLIPERSHTVLKIGHAGMRGGAEIKFGVAPMKTTGSLMLRRLPIPIVTNGFPCACNPDTFRLL